jgi:hypothetical protein
MADYLTRLGTRAVNGDAPSVQPRLPSRYEGTSADDIEIESDEARPEPPPAIRRAAVQQDATAPAFPTPAVEPAPDAAEPLSPALSPPPPATTEVDDDEPQPVPVHTMLTNLNVLHEVVHQLTNDEDQHRDQHEAAPVALLSTVDVAPPVPAHEPAPIVKVTIGRIEVRAASTPTRQPAATPTVTPYTTPQPPPGERLSAYLRGERREGPR